MAVSVYCFFHALLVSDHSLDDIFCTYVAGLEGLIQRTFIYIFKNTWSDATPLLTRQCYVQGWL